MTRRWFLRLAALGPIMGAISSRFMPSLPQYWTRIVASGPAVPMLSGTRYVAYRFPDPRDFVGWYENALGRVVAFARWSEVERVYQAVKEAFP